MTCLNQCLSLVCLSPLGYVCKSLVCLITCLLVQRTRFLERVGNPMVADAITAWCRRSGIHHCSGLLIPGVPFAPGICRRVIGVQQAPDVLGHRLRFQAVGSCPENAPVSTHSVTGAVLLSPPP